MPETHDPYAALRFGDYRRLVSSSMLSTIAREVQAVAVGWELYQRTGSAAALGIVGLVQFLPVLFLSLPAGHAADRYDRKHLLIGSVLTALVASVGLAFVSQLQGPVALIYLCVAIVGVAQAFSAPCCRLQCCRWLARWTTSAWSCGERSFSD
jgi:MFS family permease